MNFLSMSGSSVAGNKPILTRMMRQIAVRFEPDAFWKRTWAKSISEADLNGDLQKFGPVHLGATVRRQLCPEDRQMALPRAVKR